MSTTKSCGVFCASGLVTCAQVLQEACVRGICFWRRCRSCLAERGHTICFCGRVLLIEHGHVLSFLPSACRVLLIVFRCVDSRRPMMMGACTLWNELACKMMCGASICLRSRANPTGACGRLFSFAFFPRRLVRLLPPSRPAGCWLMVSFEPATI